MFSRFSLEGPEVEFTAPGNNTLTWWPVNKVETLKYVNGTSPAAAFAAGFLALGYSRYNTDFNPTGGRLLEIATPAFNPTATNTPGHGRFGQQDSFFGYGLLDAGRMLNQKWQPRH